ncbi:MAG: 30S ribosomal protein S2, partial [Candidatus Diapherotrites archaeon]|nr:30S ribosomal protein S2 [Candidatus Diapherotrites archaeon]
HEPAKQFAATIGARSLTARFIPGTLTNPQGKIFLEPKILIITEPEPDSQAIAEARTIHIPVIALCSTNNTYKNVDLVIPVNNKGRKSLALVYWLLAREYLKIRGTPIPDAEMEAKLPLFEQPVKESSEERPQTRENRFRRRPDRRGGRGGERRGRR